MGDRGQWRDGGKIEKRSGRKRRDRKRSGRHGKASNRGSASKAQGETTLVPQFWQPLAICGYATPDSAAVGTLLAPLGSLPG